MRTMITVLVTLGVSAAPLVGQQSLDMYFIDVEGGQATLYVSPTGESMLVDTGNPGERDLNRILEVLQIAGVQRIDHLLTSHYHIDHYGVLAQLVERVPVARFYDHGPSAEADRPRVQEFEAQYRQIVARGQHTVLKPGDRIPLGGVEVIVVASADQFITQPLAGAPGAGQPNPACATFQPAPRPEPDPDNDHSVGFVMVLGQFRHVNLSDLTWDREGRLMCPNNPIGTVDLFLTSHHGLDRSNAPVLIHALRPRVAIMNNGTRKGGSALTFEHLYSSPGLEDLWQLHWSYNGGVELNAPGVFIANIDDAPTLASIINPPEQPAGGGRMGGPGGMAAANHSPAHYIKVTARQDGSFTVTNSRNGFTKTYAPAR